MPKTILSDWNLAQALVLQGLPFRDVAARIGVSEAVLRKRSWRGGWLKLRTESVHAVAENGGKTLAERSRTVRDSLAAELEDQVSVLREKPAKNASELGNTPQRQGRSTLAKCISDAAKVVFNWDTEPGAMLFMGSPPEPVCDVEAAVASEPADSPSNMENKPSLVTAGD